MNLEEIKELKALNDSPFPIKSRSSFKDGYINVNHKISIRIENVASYFETNQDISVYNHSGQEIGVLCFTKQLGETNWRALTENQFIAFLSEGNYGDRENNFKFDYNYLIIHDSEYDNYKDYYWESSSIWGGFNHLTSVPMVNYKKAVSEIHLWPIELDKDIFKENSRRAVLQPFGHERFLKLYHLLELRFDVDVVKEIQKLDIETNPEKIGQILNDYSQKEFLRLRHIIETNCINTPQLVSFLNQITNFQPLAEQIFYKFGKDSNPFKDFVKFKSVTPFGFAENTLVANGVNFQGNYGKFINHLASYWIYRIRCSIAHNKIGEYIISHGEEDFLVEFAEPLLKEVLKQCFKR